MYWTEALPADFNLSRANLDGSNVEFLITNLGSPSGIALDLQPTAVPTASEWGFAAMVLILLTIGAIRTIELNRHHSYIQLSG